MIIIKLCAFCNLHVLSYLHVRRVCRRPFVGNLQSKVLCKVERKLRAELFAYVSIHMLLFSIIIYVGICHFAVHVTTTYCSQYIKYIYKMYSRPLVVV